MYKLFSFIFTLMIVGCSSPTVPTNENKPYWLEESNFLNDNFVVGFSKPTFQGMYMQRQNALHDAKEKLSHKIKSIISSNSSEAILAHNQKVSLSQIRNVEAFSNVLLSDIKQYDAYINNKNELYLLVGKSDSALHVEHKNVQDFNNKELLNSACYTKEILSQIHTSSKIYRGKPLWFYTPKNAAIGIAPKTDNDFQKQKSTAITLAKMDLIKKRATLIESNLKLTQLLRHDKSASIMQTKGFEKSNSNLDSFELLDIWMNPKNCELYVLITQ